MDKDRVKGAADQAKGSIKSAVGKVLGDDKLKVDGAADTAKGNRPSFTDAAPPEEAEPVYEAFCAALRELGVEVATGVFGAKMAVELVNDGPVTIVVDR